MSSLTSFPKHVTFEEISQENAKFDQISSPDHFPAAREPTSPAQDPRMVQSLNP